MSVLAPAEATGTPATPAARTTAASLIMCLFVLRIAPSSCVLSRRSAARCGTEHPLGRLQTALYPVTAACRPLVRSAPYGVTRNGIPTPRAPGDLRTRPT